jgi:hypothetical protein
MCIALETSYSLKSRGINWHDRPILDSEQYEPFGRSMNGTGVKE